MPRRYFDAPDGQVHYIEEGDGDQTVVLLHQIPTAADIWANLINELAPRYHVIAPDLPGFGKSDPLPAGFGVADISARIAPVIENVARSKVRLFGVHLGAVVTAEFARSRSDLVECAVLGGYPFTNPDESAARIEWVRDQSAGLPGPLPITVPTEDGAHLLKRWHVAYRMACWAKGDLPPALSDEQLQFAGKLLTVALDSWRATPQAFLAAFRYDAEAMLPQIKVPVLAMHVTGAHEGAHNKRSEQLAALIPGARTAALDADSAFFHYWHPVEIAGLLEDFWTSL